MVATTDCALCFCREIDGTLSLQYYASMLMRVFKCEGLKSDWEYLCQEVYDGDLDKVPLEYGEHASDLSALKV